MSPIIGKSLTRKEDFRLVTGNGRYSDDVSLPGEAHAVFVRSPHAHARIRSIDTTAARGMRGVLAVLTGADVLADGLKPVPHSAISTKPGADILLRNSDGSTFGYAPQDILPHDRARYVGEQVAMVVAESVSVAKDAADRVAIDYEPLTPITATAAAAQPGAPQLYDDVANTCVDADVGSAASVDAAFARAAHVARLETWVQ